MLIEDGFNEVLNHLSMRILINIAPPNNSMKKTIVFLWCYVFLCSLVLHAQSPDTPTHLVIHQNNGNSISILLSDKPKITFPKEYTEILYIETTENTYRFMMARSLYSIFFTNKDAIVEKTNVNENAIKQQGDQLCFSTSKPNTHISITDINGTTIMSKDIDSGEFYYPLSDLSAGIYIAKINNTTIKFIKR